MHAGALWSGRFEALEVGWEGDVCFLWAFGIVFSCKLKTVCLHRGKDLTIRSHGFA